MKFSEPAAKKYLQDFCKKGDVLFWWNFPGKERLRNSHFVLLTNCIKLSEINRSFCEDGFMVARATAQTQHFINGAKRQNHDTIFIKKGETEIFPEDTVIDLTWHDYFIKDELAKILGQQLESKGNLGINLIKRINKCVFNARTLSPSKKDLILKS